MADDVLRAYHGYLDSWYESLYGDDIQIFWPEIPHVKKRYIKAMKDGGSALFIDIVNEMKVNGVENTLRGLKVAYLERFFDLSSKRGEIDEKECEDLIWLLEVGDKFLQNLADKASSMKGDAAVIASIIGKHPQGAGVNTTVKRNSPGCQTGSNDEKEQEGELVCNQTQQEQQNSTRRKGRPKNTLKDKMVDDADGEKLQKIHAIWGNSKGKDAALIILACIQMGWMKKPTFTQVIVEFGDVGSKSGYNRYLNSKSFTDDEIKGIMNALNSL